MLIVFNILQVKANKLHWKIKNNKANNRTREACQQLTLKQGYSNSCLYWHNFKK